MPVLLRKETSVDGISHAAAERHASDLGPFGKTADNENRAAAGPSIRALIAERKAENRRHDLRSAERTLAEDVVEALDDLVEEIEDPESETTGAELYAALKSIRTAAQDTLAAVSDVLDGEDEP